MAFNERRPEKAGREGGIFSWVRFDDLSRDSGLTMAFFVGQDIGYEDDLYSQA